MQIYISRNGEKKGPYSIEDVNAYLKDGTLLPTDLACHEGMDEWMPLNEMELSGLVVKLDSSESTPELSKPQEDSPELPETEEASKGMGNKRLFFVGKSVAVFILFGILAYWASEASFRPPPVDSNYNTGEWGGWEMEWTGRNRSGNKGGPVKIISDAMYELGPTYFYGMVSKELFEWKRASDHPSGWVFFVSICGAIFGMIRARSWSKNAIEKQVFDEPFTSQTLRSWLIRTALILALVIVAFETRNGLRRGERESNFKLIVAVTNGDIEETKTQLSDGADINVIIRKVARHTLVGDKVSKEDLKLLWMNYSGYDRHHGPSNGVTPLHIAIIEGHKDIVELLLSKGANVNAKAIGEVHPEKTPLDLALVDPFIEDSVKKEIVELLRKHGAKDSSDNAKAKKLTPKEEEKDLRNKVVGTYQMNLPNGLFTMTLLKDGKSIHDRITNSGEKVSETGKWKIEGGNLFLIGEDLTGIMKIKPDGSLVPIAEIKNGVRKNLDPRISAVTSFKKIK